MKYVCILAIDTSTANCTVALLLEKKVYSKEQVGNNIHSQVLLSMIEEVVAEAGIELQQIEAIAVGRGPGSFTGLRIGIGVAQGLAFAIGCPMIGVCSLSALANQVAQQGTIITALDARMNEVYWAVFCREGDQLVEQVGAQVSSPRCLLESEMLSGSFVVAVGNGWQAYEDELSPLGSKVIVRDDLLYPRANSMLSLAKQCWDKGLVCAASEFTPVYVRDNVAKKSQKKLL